MVNWLNMEAMRMNQLLAEDVSAPELRNFMIWHSRHTRNNSISRFTSILRSFLL